MSSELPAFGFSVIGVIFALLTIIALCRGEIRERNKVVIYRRNDPVGYYGLVIFCAFLTSVFIVAGIYFFLHPGIIPGPTGRDADPD